MKTGDEKETNLYQDLGIDLNKEEYIQYKKYSDIPTLVIEEAYETLLANRKSSSNWIRGERSSNWIHEVVEDQAYRILKNNDGKKIYDSFLKQGEERGLGARSAKIKMAVWEEKEIRKQQKIEEDNTKEREKQRTKEFLKIEQKKQQKEREIQEKEKQIAKEELKIKQEKEQKEREDQVRKYRAKQDLAGAIKPILKKRGEQIKENQIKEQRQLRFDETVLGQISKIIKDITKIEDKGDLRYLSDVLENNITSKIRKPPAAKPAKNSSKGRHS